MGGTLWACGPGQTIDDVFELDDPVSMYYRYSGFTDFKGIILKATIAFLIALSGKQISKKLLIDAGIITQEEVWDMDEAVVIANYCSRIDAAIPLLKSWLNTKRDPRPKGPIHNMFGGFGSCSDFGQLLAQQSFLADFLADLPIDYDVINPGGLEPEQVAVPHTLTELRLAGIHHFLLFPDANGTLPYEKVEEVERLLKMVRSYCEFDPHDWGGPPPPPEYQPPRVRAPAPATDILASDDTDGGGSETKQDEDPGAEMPDGDDADEQHFISETAAEVEIQPIVRPMIGYI
ncbi:hypothetical protein DFH07DRAFT_977189 [Mycena maculata]|uniref:Uncharacterized protein n=1 Tax=Mycena maculata TaxID=230809 RepID=A0AAD7IN17_9AGAR|nr:hypothetical protein DFH07DRAFT_977189 [Mycena maculata]